MSRSATLAAPLNNKIPDRSGGHQDGGAEEDGAHADMAADEAAADRAEYLAGILRRYRIAQDAAGDRLRHVVADDAGDAGQEAAERQPHQETQNDELPAVGHERLRDQQRCGNPKRDVDDAPMANAIG